MIAGYFEGQRRGWDERDQDMPSFEGRRRGWDEQDQDVPSFEGRRRGWDERDQVMPSGHGKVEMEVVITRSRDGCSLIFEGRDFGSLDSEKI